MSEAEQVNEEEKFEDAPEEAVVEVPPQEIIADVEQAGGCWQGSGKESSRPRSPDRLPKCFGVFADECLARALASRYLSVWLG